MRISNDICKIAFQMSDNLELFQMTNNPEYQIIDKLDKIIWEVFNKYLTKNYKFYHDNVINIQTYKQKFLFIIDGDEDYEKKVIQFFSELRSILPLDCILDIHVENDKLELTITKSFKVC